MATTTDRLPGVDRLREWITRSKLKQYEAADLLGMPESLLSQILGCQRRPGLDNALVIERVTGISVEHWSLSSLSSGDPQEFIDAKKRRISKA